MANIFKNNPYNPANSFVDNFSKQNFANFHAGVPDASKFFSPQSMDIINTQGMDGAKLFQQDMAKAGAKSLDKVDDVVGKAGGFMDKIGKFGDMANKVMAPVAAVGSLVSLGFDIKDTIEQQKQAKEQLDLAKKNMNLELEKAQKQEHAYNKLAASVDKAWGGDGKIENTIDYSQYKTDAGGGNSIVAGGKGGEYIQDPYENSRNADSTNASLASGSNELGGSGNMPTMNSGAPLQPVGYSEGMPSEEQEEGA